MGLAGGMGLLAPAFFSACTSDDYILQFFEKDEFKFIDILGEFILPETDKSPGARTAKVANFIDHYISVCYTETQQLKCRNGIIAIQEECRKNYNSSFVKMSNKRIGEVLINPKINSILISEGIKDLLLLGYFTSQSGMTKALRYVAIPGKYEGDIAYQDGERAWAL